jgi:CDP-paratose synthetase
MNHIVLTGATGFLGSHLLSALLSKGYSVTILKRTSSDTYRIKDLLSQVRVVDVDITPLEDAFMFGYVDTVIHTACSYGRDGEGAQSMVESNLLFGLNVLETAVRFKTRSFLNTDTVLPKYLNSYSMSKKQYVEWIKQFTKQIQIVNLRIEHFYGPKDDARKFLPWLISQFENNVARIPLTEGTQLRDFVYIDDVVAAYQTILRNIQNLSEFNEFDIATGDLISVRDLVNKLHVEYKRLNVSNSILGFGDVAVREGEMTSGEVDMSMLLNLGWEVTVPLDKGIKKLFERES